MGNDQPHQRGQVVRRLFPAGYCHLPTTELAKTERGPISTSGASIFSMSPKFSMLPNQALPSDKSSRFSLLDAARPMTIRSWQGAINARGSRLAGRMTAYRNARYLSSVHPSHHFVSQHPGKQVALTLDMSSASDMMNGNTLEIVRPRWLGRQWVEVVAKLNTMDDQATSRVFPGTEAVRFPESLGFRTGSMSVHTSRTMMFEELGLVLDRIPQTARKGEYEWAIVEQNVLGEPTRTTRMSRIDQLRKNYLRLCDLPWDISWQGRSGCGSPSTIRKTRGS